MRSSSALLLAVAVSLVWFAGGPAHAIAIGPVTELSGPGDFTTVTNVIDFEGHPEGTAANTLYLAQGVEFQNTGSPVPILDWTSLSRVTTSPTNVIGTISNQQTGSDFTDYLDLFFASGALEVGAWFGNDQGLQPTMQMELSVFDISDALIGSVIVDFNENTSVDQFAGLRSDSTPFYRARFEHILAQGDLSVVLDDVRFTAPVPEPGSAALLALGLGALAARRWRRA